MKLKFSVLAITLLLGVTGTFAQDKKGQGARFDTRDPTSCASRKEPTKGALTADQAKQYWLCEAEVMVKAGSPENDQLKLRTNVIVEVGKGRPYNINTDSDSIEIDPSQTVYPIRGSYTGWICGSVHPLGAVGIAAGKNCVKAENPGATGTCFKTAFGDWRCVMAGVGLIDGNNRIPGPKGN
jgi:hypothetical protein